MHPLPSSTIIFQFLPHPPREIRSSNPFGTLLPPPWKVDSFAQGRGDRGAFAPCASGVVRGGRQWRHRSPYDDVKAGQRYVTQAWREVDRSPTALLFIPFPRPLSFSLSLSRRVFFSRGLRCVNPSRLGRIQPLLPCFLFLLFSFLRIF